MKLPSIEEFTKEMESVSSLSVDAEPAMWLAVVGNLQLALRHPNNKGTTTVDLVKEFIASVIAIFKEHAPLVAQVLEAGNDPSYDVEFVPVEVNESEPPAGSPGGKHAPASSTTGTTAAPPGS